MTNPNITIGQLAKMVNEGFKSPASKEDIKEVTTRLDGIDSRLDRIEHLLLSEPKREIKDLKQRMQRLEDAFAV